MVPVAPILYLIVLHWSRGVIGDPLKSSDEVAAAPALAVPSEGDEADGHHPPVGTVEEPFTLMQMTATQSIAIVDSDPASLNGVNNVTAALGKTASLSCRIRGLTNRTQVAWIRYRDLQLLTVGETTYTADQRFTAAVGAHHSDGTIQWSLHIQNVQFKDEGGYECQVGITPRVSRHIYLSVVEPTTTILGGSEMHIDVGSTINLTCLIQHTPEPPDHVFWTHNQQTVNYDSKRGGISVMIERGQTTLSSLLIQKAARKDSGVYVCSPSSAPAASASIHILEGERPAAMYSISTRTSPSFMMPLNITALLLPFLVLLMISSL